MQNTIPMPFVIILAVVIMFIVPSYQILVDADNKVDIKVYTETTKFVDSVRTKGYLTPQMLEEFQSTIEIGSYRFRVEMVHEKKMYTPVYTNPQDLTSFTGEYEVQYDEFHTKQINDYLYNTGHSKNNLKYKMAAGDFFTVHVENISRPPSSVLKDFFQGRSGEDVPIIVIPYGGMVLNENY